jgi:hypothetical protein
MPVAGMVCPEWQTAYDLRLLESLPRRNKLPLAATIVKAPWKAYKTDELV